MSRAVIESDGKLNTAYPLTTGLKRIEVERKENNKRNEGKEKLPTARRSFL